MSKLNYRNIALRELKEFVDRNSDYTLGEILYSIVRFQVKEGDSIGKLRDLTDEEVYTIIDKAKETEEFEEIQKS